MIDLVCLVADKSMEAAVDAILRRPQALGIRQIGFETVVHPQRDPGCFHAAPDLLLGYRDQAGHALVMLDRAWDGAPAGTGVELEKRLEESLRASGLGEWARAVVIDPELEVWVFSDSPHVASTLGCQSDMAALRDDLETRNLWPRAQAKPPDPKTAVEWALRRAKTPRSSSLFRELARTVSLDRCQDRAFMRFKEALGDWFGGRQEEQRAS